MDREIEHESESLVAGVLLLFPSLAGRKLHAKPSIAS
jgi:hypothetical protein